MPSQRLLIISMRNFSVMRTFLERLKQMSTERREFVLSQLTRLIYDGHQWQKLFEYLDNVEYGLAKIQYDESASLLTQGLDLGRDAAVRSMKTFTEEIASLPYLWKYTWLKCRLTRRAANCSDDVIRALLCLQRDTEAYNLVDMQVDFSQRTEGFLAIARWLEQQPGREQERVSILLKACEGERAGGMKDAPIVEE